MRHTGDARISLSVHVITAQLQAGHMLPSAAYTTSLTVFFSVVSFRLWRRGPRLTHYITLQFTIYITYNFYCAI